MDLSQIPERDRQHVTRLLEAKQAEQFMTLYGSIVSDCFKDCANDFTSENLSNSEKDCLKKCTVKFIKITNKAGMFMAEKQMASPTAPSGEPPKPL